MPLKLLPPQVECCKLEGQFYEEVHALECKYADMFKPLCEKVGVKSQDDGI